MIFFNELLGISFTMCHLTGKQPVHLSCCQYSTVLLKSTRPTISARPRNYPAGVNLENRGRQETSTSNLTHRFIEGAWYLSRSHKHQQGYTREAVTICRFSNGAWYLKQHRTPCTYRLKGYTREAVTICRFSSNVPRASQQAQKDL